MNLFDIKLLGNIKQTGKRVKKQHHSPPSIYEQDLYESVVKIIKDLQVNYYKQQYN